MSNSYTIYSTIDSVHWPEYVSRIALVDGKYLEKAAHVVDMALVTLEAYGGPNYTLQKLNKAARKCVYLYEINADLIDASDEVHECNLLILYEPWMKANCIAQASLEFVDNEAHSKIVVRRKENVAYYKNDELLYENGEAISSVPRSGMHNTAM